MKRVLLFAVPALLVLGPLTALAQTPCEETGVITNITQTELKVRTASGNERSFDLTSETMDRPAGLAVGDRVHIACRDELTDDVALSIHKLAPGETYSGSKSTTTSQNNPNYTGTQSQTSRTSGQVGIGVEGSVVSVNSSTLVVRTDAGEVRTFHLQPGGLTMSVVPGDRIRVDYSTAGTEMTATNVSRLSATSTSRSNMNDNDRYNTSANGRLPETAGPLPMIALLAVASLGTWMVLRRKARRP